jgi:hypothetical protein
MLCTLVGGEEKPGPETDVIGFFGETDIPELSLTGLRRHKSGGCLDTIAIQSCPRILMATTEAPGIRYLSISMAVR